MTRVPILRFSDGTTVNRLVGPGLRDAQDFGTSPPEGRVYFEGTSIDRDPDRASRWMVEYDQDGLVDHMGVAREGGSFYLDDKWILDHAYDPWVTASGSVRKWASLVRLFDLVRVVPGAVLLGSANAARVPALAPDWLFQESGEAEPAFLDSDTDRWRSVDWSQDLLRYVQSSVLGGMATVRRLGQHPWGRDNKEEVEATVPVNLSRLSEHWYRIEPDHQADPADQSRLVLTVYPGFRDKWTVRSAPLDDQHYAETTRGETLPQAVRRNLLRRGLWPESMGLDDWLTRLCFPVEEVLVDPTLWEAYQLLGQRTPWLWLDHDLQTWLDQQ